MPCLCAGSVMGVRHISLRDVTSRYPDIKPNAVPHYYSV